MRKKLLGFGAVCSIPAIIGLMFSHYSDELMISPKGAEIIGNAEGCQRDPYHCPSDVLTVGVGSTEAGGEKINPQKRYSDEEIARRWKNDLVVAQNCVNEYANGRAMPQGVYDASVSLTFNVGCGAMRKSTLFKKANREDWQGVCYELPKWVYASGRKLPGLVVRREKEKRLCLADLTSH